jgi:signal transduction histidine kinase
MSTTDQQTLTLAPVDLGHLVGDVVRRFSDAALAQGRRLRVDPAEGVVIPGDRSRLDSALSNLVANALDHGAGDIDIVLRAEDGCVAVHVRDSGPGLDPSVRHTAFDPMTRGGSTGRSGLGLAIVAAVAVSHGGAAGITNRDTGGVDAWIRVPTERHRRHQWVMATP